MCHFPCISNTGSLAVRNSNGMDGVCIMMIKNKQVVIAAAGGDQKLACLVRVRFEKLLFAKKHGTKLMTIGFKRRGKI
jgi:hypothetical protein